MKIKKNTVLYASTVLACGNIALQILAFLYRVILSRYAGAEGLGVYRLVNSAYMIIHASCISGVTLACSRLSAAAQARHEKNKISAILRLAFSVFFTIISVWALIFYFKTDMIAESFLGDSRCAKAFPFVLICLALTGIENIFKSLFIGLGRMQYTSYSEVGEQLVRIAAVWILLNAYGGDDYGIIAMLIFLGMVISEIFSVVFLSTVFRKERPLLVKERGKIDKHLIHHFFIIALPVCSSSLISNVLNSMGNVLLPKRLMVSGLTYEEALSALGIVSGMAMPLMLLPIALVSSVGTALLPTVVAAHATGNKKRLQTLVERAISTIGLIAIPATAFLVPLAPGLSELFYKVAIPSSYFYLLGIVAVLTYYQIITASLLNGVGLQQYNFVTLISGEILQIASIYVFAANSKLGINGYLYAMVLAEAFVTLLNLIILHRHTGFRVRVFRRFAVPIICGATTFAWTRIFLAFFTHHCSSMTVAILLAALGAVLLYLLILRLCNVHVFAYLKHRVEHNGEVNKARTLYFL